MLHPAAVCLLVVSAVNLDGRFSAGDITADTLFHVDPTRKATLADVQGLPDAAWQRGAPSGVVGATVWMKAELVSHLPGSSTWWLEVGNQYAALVELFDGATRRQGGQTIALREDSIRRRTPTFALELAPGKTRTVYGTIDGEGPLFIALNLGRPEHFGARDTAAAIFNGWVYGLMLIMCIYSLVLAFFLRARTHLYYALYTLCSLVWLFAMCGDLRVLFWRHVDHVEHAHQHVPILVAQLFALAFCRALLETRTRMPRADVLLRVLRAVVLLDLVFGLVLPWVFVSSFIALLTPVLYLSYAGVGVVAAVRGFHPARYYAVAWALLFAMLVPSAMSAVGILPPWILDHSMHLAFALDVSFLALALADNARVQNQRILRLHDAGTRFVPFEFLSLLGRKELPEVQHGDQVQRTMTVYFSDVRGFTTLVEGMTPSDTIRFVNDYLGVMEPPITAHHGFIDKYIGDAVMALFESADDAVAGALEGLRDLARENERRTKRGVPAIAIGIGLHTGALMLGTVGSQRRINCTVLGDSVNLASRIEGMTKLYGASLLVSGATRTALLEAGRYSMRQVDRVAAKGKTEPVIIHEVLDGLAADARGRKEATREDFEAACALFVKGEPAAALELFEKCRAVDAHDVALALYVERCRHFLATGVPAGWDGVVRLDHK